MQPKNCGGPIQAGERDQPQLGQLLSMQLQILSTLWAHVIQWYFLSWTTCLDSLSAGDLFPLPD